MKNLLKRLRALLRLPPRPDPLELIVQAFALDPFRRPESRNPNESRIDKVEDSK
jgi:hypothetical protein